VNEATEEAETQPPTHGRCWPRARRPLISGVIVQTRLAAFQMDSKRRGDPI
jgi:hypothetical protein